MVLRLVRCIVNASACLLDLSVHLRLSVSALGFWHATNTIEFH
jgi:hypothetical protein